MKLPNADLVKVEREKITQYLLNAGHRYGASKARFFSSFGFSLLKWETLALALEEHAQQYEMSKVTETIFGPRFEVEGELKTPDGRNPRVRSVWQVDHGMVAPRLITAYLWGLTMINEHECVVLTEDLPAEGLKACDIETVVHIHQDGVAYEVEFMTLAGETIAVTTLLAAQVRPLARRDMAHARELSIA